MNIFYLDGNTITNARYHADKHVVKMIVEYAQLLCTAHRVLDSNVDPVLYKATHINHPCAKWVRESWMNYDYLHRLWSDLCEEYTFRYNRRHATDIKLGLKLHLPPNNIPIVNKTPHPQCMPDHCKVENDPVAAYRLYYNTEKRHLHKWTNRTIPEWITTDDS